MSLVTEEFIKNKFFFKYNKFIDANLAKANIDAYKKKLSMVGRMVKDVQFNGNAILCCNRDVSKEIFLTGFSKLDYYCTHVLYNISDVLDIHFGNRSEDSNEREDDIYVNSDLDILQDVLCLTVNYHEASNVRADDVCCQMIMNRYNYRGSKPKYTWIYSMSGEAELKIKYPNLYNLFKNAENPLFRIYDLNSVPNVIYGTNMTVKKAGTLDLDL